LLPVWVHIRFCGCGVYDDDDDATATNDSAVKIKTIIIIIIIAVRAHNSRVVHTYLKQYVCIFGLDKLMLTYLA
jgi:hypothetical protein